MKVGDKVKIEDGYMGKNNYPLTEILAIINSSYVLVDYIFEYKKSGSKLFDIKSEIIKTNKIHKQYLKPIRKDKINRLLKE